MTGGSPAMRLESLVETISESWGRSWTIWQTVGNEWCVGPLGQHTVRAASFEQAIADAAAMKPLPVIPRPPVVYAGLEVERDDATGWWNVTESYVDPIAGRRTRLWGERTKVAAVEKARALERRTAADYDRWHAEYGRVVDGGSPGVDFRWQ